MNIYKPQISIIIPLYDINERFFRDFIKYDFLEYPSFEIIVVSDKKVVLPKLKKSKVRLILTNKIKTGPAEKRDLAIKIASGNICAFIDDDAYPDKNWLKNAIKWFSNKDIVAVGGPGITPVEDSYWEKISGLIYESFFCSGGALYRFVKQPTREVDDYPAYNLLVRKSILKKVGGYGTSYYGGEDTFLCLKLIKYGKIFYDPEVLVYHHRRKLFFGLLKQIANIGKHRGYFSKVFPETSRKPMYYYPSFLTLGFITFLIVSIYTTRFLSLYLLTVLGFTAIGGLSINKNISITQRLLVGIGIIMVHLTYGVNFVRGLFVNNLIR